MFTVDEKIKIRAYYDLAMNRITEKHINCFKGHMRPVFLISEQYPGVWLEHVYDSVFFAKLDSSYMDIAKNTLDLFLDNQKENGQLPYKVVDRNKCEAQSECGYAQIQECVSFARLCYEYYELSGDSEFLKKAYDKCAKWVSWYEKYRMPGGKGLAEMFCGYDTGHDNSGRLEGMLYKKAAKDNDAGVYPDDDEVLPVIAPDINAVFYGNLTALYSMAKALGNGKENIWLQKAENVKKKLMEICYDEGDAFFYDVDKNGNMRRYLSISITNVFSEHMLTKDEFDIIYDRHMKNPEEFYTPYPFPSMAVSDPSFKQNLSGNSWGFYSQALTILRCTRWMDYYGRGEDFDKILEIWIRQWTFGNDIMFGQELNPLTGKTSDCSQWYSSCMLLYIYAVQRLL